MELKEIESLVEQKNYQEALSECGKLLTENPSKKREILRTREYIYTLCNDYESAIKDYEAIFESCDGMIGDYYQGAFRCLHAEEYDKASAWFLVVLKMGEEQNETWFKSATLFYLSYIKMELERFDEAIVFLDKAVEVESDVGMPIPGVGMSNASQLRKEIIRRKALN